MTLSTTPTNESMLAIADRMVRLYKHAFGRGPRRARASFAGPDGLVVVLEQTLTAAELTLAELGAHERLRETRLFAQTSLDDDARAIVEQVLGRPTVAVVTGLDAQRDVAAHFFALGRAGDAAGSAPGAREDRRARRR